MTSTDTGWIPQPPQPPSSAPRVLRRSPTDRVGAGVAGGLGQYFGIDPVLFRVLFAVSAFFGGAGILAYVVAWAAIPEEGTVKAPVDRFVNQLRRRRVPIWIVAVVAGLVLWGLAFSWWAPGPFIPVMLVVILLVAVFGHRAAGNSRGFRDGAVAGGAAPAGPAPASGSEPVGAAPTINLQKGATDATDTTAGAGPATGEPVAPGAPDWVGSTRSWIAEAQQASRERRRRAFPVRITVLASLAGTLIALGIADAVSGVRLPVYFWVTLGIVGLGLLVGGLLRRTPWSMLPLLILSIAGTIAFGNSHASLHDGVGQSDWTPANAGAIRSDYRLAFGQGNLDLSGIGTVSVPRDIDVTMAAGQAKIVLPNTLNATVYANVRMGVIEVDGRQVADTNGGSIRRVNGYDISHTVVPPAGAKGAAVTITVHVADGNVTVDHR